MSQFPPIDRNRCQLLYKNFDCPWGGKEDIYAVPLDMLHLNVTNGRIATWVSGHERNPSVKKFSEMTQEEWNETLARFIKESNSKEEYQRTRKSILQDGQLKVGAILPDGTIVAGNRRCSILMDILAETGDHERFGYFKCAIIDVPDTEEGRKQLKRLETKTQYGEDTPVAYGPIEKLVDVYNNVIVTNHPYSASEYQNFLGLTKSEMEKLIRRADIMVDYLEYLGQPLNFEIARIEKLDGPINELANLAKGLDRNEWNRIKHSFYRTLKEGWQKGGDRTREIRQQIKVYRNDPETFNQDLASTIDDIFANDARSFGTTTPAPSIPSVPVQSRNDFWSIAAMRVDKKVARAKPITFANNALQELVKIDIEAINIMDAQERERFFRAIEAVLAKAGQFTRDKFE